MNKSRKSDIKHHPEIELPENVVVCENVLATQILRGKEEAHEGGGKEEEEGAGSQGGGSKAEMEEIPQK